MANPQLLDYIKKELARGVSRENLKAVLIANRWRAQEIDAALKEAQPEEPEQVLKGIIEEAAKKESLVEKQPSTPQIEKPSSIERKNFPFKYLIIGLIVIVLVSSAFSYYLFFYKEKSEESPLSVNQQVLLLSKSFCNQYCKETKCELFKNPSFSAEELQDKSCTDLGIKCDKCA